MTSAPESKIASRMLFLIAGHKLADQAVALLQKQGVPMQYTLQGMGTATSEMMDLLGLGTAEKTILTTFLPKEMANRILTCLNDLLEEVERKNRGIAFTIPLLSANKLLLRLLGDLAYLDEEQVERKDDITVMSERKYSLITAVVNPGYSEEVMNAARSAGARGGTVLHSRQVGNEQARTTLGLDVQEEKEMILIVADNEQKSEIMKAIGENCGLHSEAKGIVLSLPIDNAIGLR